MELCCCVGVNVDVDVGQVLGPTFGMRRPINAPRYSCDTNRPDIQITQVEKFNIGHSIGRTHSCRLCNISLKG